MHQKELKKVSSHEIVLSVLALFLNMVDIALYFAYVKQNNFQIAKCDDDAALLVQSSTMLDDKFTMKSAEASAATQVSISPTFYEKLFCKKVFFKALLYLFFGFVIF